MPTEPEKIDICRIEFERVIIFRNERISACLTVVVNIMVAALAGLLVIPTFSKLSLLWWFTAVA